MSYEQNFTMDHVRDGLFVCLVDVVFMKYKKLHRSSIGRLGGGDVEDGAEETGKCRLAGRAWSREADDQGVILGVMFGHGFECAIKV